MTNLFADLNYRQWCLDNDIHKLFGIDLDQYGDITSKMGHDLYETVDPENKVPFPAELDDLIRLHYLVRKRRVTTILEFGVGKSTVVFADALSRNKFDYGEYVKANLRRANPFEIHSVDNYADWIDVCAKEFQDDLKAYVHFYYTEVQMTTFSGRACTMYGFIPNICPDFIYLDAPDQFSVGGDIRGISTRTADRLPMSADILLLEPFLLPGTLIVVDGRTANARFLKNNLQMLWRYHHYENEDIHTFELFEKPLGKINEKQINFCLHGIE